MNWTESKDILLIRKMAAEGIFHYKAGSRERGNAWQSISRKPNEEDGFDALTARGARDRYTLITRRHKAKNSKELKSIGLGGKEQTEFDILLEEHVELSNESDRRLQEDVENVQEKAKDEKQKAMDIRKQAMETMDQTKTRIMEQNDEAEVREKKRRSGSDTMLWIERKAQLDAEWKEKQLEVQRAEKEMEREERRQEFELQKVAV